MISGRLLQDCFPEKLLGKTEGIQPGLQLAHNIVHRSMIGLSVTALALVLSGCGGSGGSSSSSGVPTATGIAGPGSTEAQAAAAEPDQPTTSEDAVRMLNQASFGPTESTIAQVQKQGAKKYVLAQFAEAPSLYVSGGDDQINTHIGDFCKDLNIGDNCWRDYYSAQPMSWDFYRNGLKGTDQLRQRMAFALSQIFVVSNHEVSGTYGLRDYHQMLLNSAFGNLRDLLKKVALHPVMGVYLNNVNNDKSDPNENFARELMQLFSIGVCELNNDGTLKGGACQATYDNAMVREYAYALTGWTYPEGGQGQWRSKWFNYTYLKGQMVSKAAGHDTAEHKLLNGVVVPGGVTADVAIDKVIDSLFNHPNIAPFMAQRLIQFFVTSNPSPAYVARVSAAFNSGVSADGGIGSGARGDLKAVIAQILLDKEVRGDTPTDPNFGKLREPVLYHLGFLRALNGTTDGDPFYWMGSGVGQQVFNSPSVFNFYAPDYPLPGIAGKLGPQFGLENENTTLARMNFFNAYVYCYNANLSNDWCPKPSATNPIPNATGTRANIGSFEVYADDPAVLVDKIIQVSGTTGLPGSDRQLIIDAINAWTVANAKNTYKTERVKTAAYMVFSSPYYAIQR